MEELVQVLVVEGVGVELERQQTMEIANSKNNWSTNISTHSCTLFLCTCI